MENTRNIEVTESEARMIYAMRRHGLKPFTILMDGIELCNARKINSQYNQHFFTDRGRRYEEAFEEFRKTGQIQEVGIPLDLGSSKIIDKPIVFDINKGKVVDDND